MIMKIVNMRGEPILACLQFHYMDYFIRVSSTLNKVCEIAIFDKKKELVSEKARTIPHALQIIDIDLMEE